LPTRGRDTLGAESYRRPSIAGRPEGDALTESATDPSDASAELPVVIQIEDDHDVVVDLTPPSRPVIVDLVTTVEPPEDLSTGLLVAPTRRLAIKRAMDIAGSLGMLLVLSPVLLVTAIAIALSSEGEVIHRQRRIGRDGRPFTMLKFRSMIVGAHEQRHLYEHRNSHDRGPIFKIPDDPRVTRVGKVIRRFSIDELPQLVNVLKGDMSLVGPRPPLPEEFETYNVRQQLRTLATPGLTCIWQVSGRSDVDFDSWVDMDLEYIKRWTIRLDLTLLLKSIPSVIAGHGAY
jgi:lipopolysaccharide/colanic/teichoic acid biosynthesis glycosyltransferase